MWWLVLLAAPLSLVTYAVAQALRGGDSSPTAALVAHGRAARWALVKLGLAARALAAWLARACERSEQRSAELVPVFQGHARQRAVLEQSIRESILRYRAESGGTWVVPPTTRLNRILDLAVLKALEEVPRNAPVPTVLVKQKINELVALELAYLESEKTR